MGRGAFLGIATIMVALGVNSIVSDYQHKRNIALGSLITTARHMAYDAACVLKSDLAFSLAQDIKNSASPDSFVKGDTLDDKLGFSAYSYWSEPYGVPDYCGVPLMDGYSDEWTVALGLSVEHLEQGSFRERLKDMVFDASRTLGYID